MGLDIHVPAFILAGAEKIFKGLDPVLRHDNLIEDIAFLERQHGQRYVIRVIFH